MQSWFRKRHVKHVPEEFSGVCCGSWGHREIPLRRCFGSHRLISGYLTPLERHLTGGFHRNFSRALKSQIFSFDLDCAVLFHMDAGITRLDRDFVADVEHEFLGNLNGLILTYLFLRTTSHGNRLVFADAFRPAACDVYYLVFPDAERL